MRAISLLLMSLLSRPSQDSVPITLSVEPNQVISGQVEIKVTTGETKGLVQLVEFYLNGDLREGITGYPYIFKLSSVDLDDGPAQLSFEVQTTQGERGRKSVTVKIDNGIAKGPAFHVERATKLLAVSKFAEAELVGRTALKAAQVLQDGGKDFDEKRDLNPVRMVLCRANMGLNKFDRAQKFVEDALASDPKNNQLIQLLAGVRLREAFRGIAKEGGDKGLQAFKNSLASVIKTNQEAAAEKMNQLGGNSEKAGFQYFEVACASGRYSKAAASLMKLFQVQSDRTDVANRLAYAQMKSGKVSEARATLRLVQRQNKADAYTYSLLSLLDSMAGDRRSADENIKEGLLADPDSEAVLFTRAHFALQNGKVAEAGTYLNKARENGADGAEISLYLSDIMARSGRLDESGRYFEDAVTQNPLLSEAYVRQGTQSLILATRAKDQSFAKSRSATAKMYFEVALMARPESVEGLTGLAICTALGGDLQSAVGLAKAATQAGPGYAPAHYLLAGLYRTINSDKSLPLGLKSMATAEDLDKGHLIGKEPPKLTDALSYFVQFGASPILSIPK